ncbi:hypothetical protein [Lentzea aerocolonigenes]|nr:hypothetical protein [Lentzea aerocolonigenes]
MRADDVPELPRPTLLLTLAAPEHADDEEVWITQHFDTGEPITVTKLPVL